MRNERCSGDVVEEWRDIAGYEGLYQVSNLGRVKSLPRGRRKGTVVLKGKDDRHGYDSVCLSKEGKRKDRKIYRLVAETFIPNPENLPVVNHIDGDKSNNKVSNLEWCTWSQNSQHAVDTGLFDPGPWHRAGVNSLKKRVIRSDGVVFESVSEAARRSGAWQSAVSRCVLGQANQTAGYSFSYYEEESA